MHELETICDLADAEVLVIRVRDSDELGRHAHWNLHVVERPKFALLLSFLLLSDECLAEDVLVLCLIV